jgi:hypothetical protein
MQTDAAGADNLRRQLLGHHGPPDPRARTTAVNAATLFRENDVEPALKEKGLKFLGWAQRLDACRSGRGRIDSRDALSFAAQGRN